MTEAPGEAAQPFSAKAVLWMILVGVFAFAAFVVLSAYAPDLRSGRDGRAHALSRSAVGYAGLTALARAAGVPTEVRRGPGPAGGVLFLTPETGVDAKRLAAAIDGADGRPVVLVLPKWQASPNAQRPGWVDQAGLIPLDAIAAGVPAPGGLRGLARRDGAGPLLVADVESHRAPVAIGQVVSPQTIRSAAWTPVFVDQHGGWLMARSVRHGNLLVVADPDLLNTQGLKDLGRARLAMTIIDDLRGQGPAVFDVSLNGFERSRGVLKLAFEPPFLAATLSAVAAALLMGLHAAARFGAPQGSQRAFALGKRALADNSAALLRLARREPAMATPYADLTRQAVAQAVAAPRRLDKAELDAVIDRLAVRAGQAPASARLTADAARVTDLAGLMAVARQLYDFRRGMTRERTDDRN